MTAQQEAKDSQARITWLQRQAAGFSAEHSAASRGGPKNVKLPTVPLPVAAPHETPPTTEKKLRAVITGESPRCGTTATGTQVTRSARANLPLHRESSPLTDSSDIDSGSCSEFVIPSEFAGSRSSRDERCLPEVLSKSGGSLGLTTGISGSQGKWRRGTPSSTIGLRSHELVNESCGGFDFDNAAAKWDSDFARHAASTSSVATNRTRLHVGTDKRPRPISRFTGRQAMDFLRAGHSQDAHEIIHRRSQGPLQYEWAES